MISKTLKIPEPGMKFPASLNNETSSQYSQKLPSVQCLSGKLNPVLNFVAYSLLR